MTTAEKNLFIKKLGTETDQQLSGTLAYYRKNSDPELMPHILGILESDRSQEIKDAVMELCMDIKSADMAIELFDYMQSTSHTPTRNLLLNTLWQINQDLSIRASQTVDILLNVSEFEPAFDCLTILENCCDNIPEDVADALHKRISEADTSAKEHLAGIISSAAECIISKKTNL
ncbi:MAG: hypothetical protein MJZ66_04520 [Bacteroidales bacterium]|nr:hypothetical protein [Bacteroidales bacterium]